MGKPKFAKKTQPARRNFTNLSMIKRNQARGAHKDKRPDPKVSYDTYEYEDEDPAYGIINPKPGDIWMHRDLDLYIICVVSVKVYDVLGEGVEEKISFRYVSPAPSANIHGMMMGVELFNKHFGYLSDKLW